MRRPIQKIIYLTFMMLTLAFIPPARAEETSAVAPQVGTEAPSESQWREDHMARQEYREEMEKIRAEHEELESEHDQLKTQCMNAKGQEHAACQQKWQELREKRESMHERMKTLHEKIEAERAGHPHKNLHAHNTEGQPAPATTNGTPTVSGHSN